MKITIDLDTSVSEDFAALHRMFAGQIPAEVAKPAGKKKPTEPVKGNPDEPAAPEASATVPAAKVSEPAASTEVASVRADAPAEIVALLKKQDHETLGKAVLKASKPKEEGGATRAVVVAILEKFRPQGNTDTLLKLSAIDKANHPKIAQLILAEYAA